MSIEPEQVLNQLQRANMREPNRSAENVARDTALQAYNNKSPSKKPWWAGLFTNNNPAESLGFTDQPNTNQVNLPQFGFKTMLKIAAAFTGVLAALIFAAILFT